MSSLRQLVDTGTGTKLYRYRYVEFFVRITGTVPGGTGTVPGGTGTVPGGTGTSVN
jgi:hypothetical protein